MINEVIDSMSDINMSLALMTVCAFIPQTIFCCGDSSCDDTDKHASSNSLSYGMFGTVIVKNVWPHGLFYPFYTRTQLLWSDSLLLPAPTIEDAICRNATITNPHVSAPQTEAHQFFRVLKLRGELRHSSNLELLVGSSTRLDVRCHICCWRGGFAFQWLMQIVSEVICN